MVRCAITRLSLYGQLRAEREAALLKQAERLAKTGIDYLQLREKELSARELVALARRLVAVLRGKEGPSEHAAGGRTRLLVNSRADVAAAAGADGVHLPSGEGQLTPDQARLIFSRAQLGPVGDIGQRVSGAAASEGASRPIVSVSCHNLADVLRARDGGADFILFGPVFGKSVEGRTVVPGTGLDALHSACTAAAGTPVLALGGVTAKNTAACIAAGARGVAGIRLFL